MSVTWPHSDKARPLHSFSRSEPPTPRMPAGVSQGLTRVETGPRRRGPERAAAARAGEQGSTGGALAGTGVRVPMWKGVGQSDPGPGQPTPASRGFRGCRIPARGLLRSFFLLFKLYEERGERRRTLQAWTAIRAITVNPISNTDRYTENRSKRECVRMWSEGPRVCM